MTGLTDEYKKTFKINEDNSDLEYLFVNIPGKGTVVIKSENEGIVVDIYSLKEDTEPVATTWADMSDLWLPEETDEIFEPTEEHKL